MNRKVLNDKSKSRYIWNRAGIVTRKENMLGNLQKKEKHSI